jgi:hypothetical protein
MGDGIPERTVRIGGQIDRSSIAVGIYGKDLDPVAISRLLICEPTHFHRRGDVRKKGCTTLAGGRLSSQARCRGTKLPR